MKTCLIPFSCLYSMFQTKICFNIKEWKFHYEIFLHVCLFVFVGFFPLSGMCDKKKAKTVPYNGGSWEEQKFVIVGILICEIYDFAVGKHAMASNIFVWNGAWKIVWH